jgi:hypothetical protein
MRWFDEKLQERSDAGTSKATSSEPNTSAGVLIRLQK